MKSVKICGIISEYNPFHKGHYLHICKTKKLLGVDTCVICCMSGNYTQRGEASIIPKHLRAKAAVLNGADLVIEIPTCYSLLSAEGFAKAGVYILDSLGIVTDLSFGAESDNIEELFEVAKLITDHEIVQKTLLHLKSGISYAAAREKALYERIKDKSNIITKPNNILGIEYLKALISLDSSIEPHSVSRIGAAHDEPHAFDGLMSASGIRSLIKGGSTEKAAEFMPLSSYEILLDAVKNGICMSDTPYFERNMFSYLLRLLPDDFSKYPDVSEGLEHRIYKAIQSSTSVAQALEKIRSKRYPLSRIRRILLRAYLGLTSEYNINPPEYCRVLAFNDQGKKLLADMRKKSSIPIITKPAHISQISKTADMSFSKESFCTDIYFTSLPNAQDYLPGIDWRTKTIII